MKNILLALSLILVASFAYSQSNIAVISPDSDTWDLVVASETDGADSTAPSSQEPSGLDGAYQKASSVGMPLAADATNEEDFLLEIVPPIIAAIPRYTLSVSTAGNGTVSSSPSGIFCGTDCSKSYVSGTTVNLSADPASGWRFSQWGGACSGSGSCSVSMISPKSVKATFTRITYTLTVAKAGSGTVSSSPPGISCGADCSQIYNTGTTVNLTATPASGWRFSHWSGNCSGSGSCSVSMTTKRWVKATFIQRHTLSVSTAGAGTISSSPSGIFCGADCSQNYDAGTTVNLTANPASGWRLGSWSGACSGSGSCSVSMTSPKSVKATFTRITYTLTVAKAGSGTVSSSPSGIFCGADCSQNYNTGTMVNLTAKPASNWRFSQWSGACSGSGSCSVAMTSKRWVKATFVYIPPAQWGVFNEVCCPSSSTIYEASQNGQYRSSTAASCSSGATFSGFLNTTQGSKTINQALKSSGCGNLYGSFYYTLQSGKRYLWVMELINGTPTAILYSENISSANESTLTNSYSNVLENMEIEQTAEFPLKQDTKGESKFQSR